MKTARRSQKGRGTKTQTHTHFLKAAEEIFSALQSGMILHTKQHFSPSQ